jgi:hypothetical protein
MTIIRDTFLGACMVCRAPWAAHYLGHFASHPLQVGLGPLIICAGPPDMVGQPRRQANTPTTLKEVHDP